MPTTVEGDLAASTSAERAPRTLFVTNDFPPRIGGAQSYYWGVIRTLDPSEVAILAPAHIDAAAFDATHPYTVVRASTSVLWPTNAMLHTVEQMAEREGAELIQLGHPLSGGPARAATASAPRPALRRVPGRRRGDAARRRSGRQQPAAARARQRVDAAHRQRVHRRGRAQADSTVRCRRRCCGRRCWWTSSRRPTATRWPACASVSASTGRSSSASVVSFRARARTS